MVNDVLVFNRDVLLAVRVIVAVDGVVRVRLACVESVHSLVHALTKCGGSLLPELDVLGFELLEARVFRVNDALKAIENLFLCMLPALRLPTALCLASTRLISACLGTSSGLSLETT